MKIENLTSNFHQTEFAKPVKKRIGLRFELYSTVEFHCEIDGENQSFYFTNVEFTTKLKDLNKVGIKDNFHENFDWTLWNNIYFDDKKPFTAFTGKEKEELFILGRELLIEEFFSYFNTLLMPVFLEALEKQKGVA